MVVAPEPARRLADDEAEHRGADQPLRLRDGNKNSPLLTSQHADRRPGRAALITGWHAKHIICALGSGISKQAAMKIIGYSAGLGCRQFLAGFAMPLSSDGGSWGSGYWAGCSRR
jgi:hypothetical protein